MSEDSEGRTWAQVVALALLSAASKGYVMAIKFAIERLEGSTPPEETQFVIRWADSESSAIEDSGRPSLGG